MKNAEIVEVVALTKITEEGFTKPGRLHVHAQAGELGQVRMLEGEWATVTFKRSTATCHVSELRAA